MNPVNILKIIIILLELIASGMDCESAVGNIASKYNISTIVLRELL